MLANVHEYILRGWPAEKSNPELAAYRLRKDQLNVQDGCILWGARVVIPQQGQDQVMKELHIAHPGISRIKALGRSYVWWPKMDKDLEELVKRCETCQDHRKQPPSAPLHPWEYPDGPWKHVHIDYAGPVDGNMLLIVVDACSKWIETYMMRSITSLTTANKLRECFAQHGMPDIVVSDNATYFVSEEFSTFLSRNGITRPATACVQTASRRWKEGTCK